MTYGLQLKGEGDEKCLSILHAVEETISRQLRACKAPSSKKRILEGKQMQFVDRCYLYFFDKHSLILSKTLFTSIA